MTGNFKEVSKYTLHIKFGIEWQNNIKLFSLLLAKHDILVHPIVLFWGILKFTIFVQFSTLFMLNHFWEIFKNTLKITTNCSLYLENGIPCRHSRHSGLTLCKCPSRTSLQSKRKPEEQSHLYSLNIKVRNYKFKIYWDISAKHEKRY